MSICNVLNTLHQTIFQEYLLEYFDCIKHQELHTDAQIVKLKAALWAVVRAITRFPQLLC